MHSSKIKAHVRSLLALSLLFYSVTASFGADVLNWRTNRVDADIQTWNLKTLLKNITAATGWEVFVEPGTTLAISTKFSNLPVQDALPRLLRSLNYALVPQTNAAPKFYVFQTSVGEATERISGPASDEKNKSPDNKSRILNQLVVTLDPNAGMSIEELARKLGAKIIGRAEGLNSYLLEFENEDATEAARDKLKSEKAVASTDSNYFFDDQPPNRDLPLGSTKPFTLKPTAVGNSDHLIVGLIDSAVNGLDSDMQAFVLPQMSVAGPNGAGDTLTHGTSMAQAMLQAMNGTENGSSGVKILPIDVYGARDRTTTYDVAYGVYTAVNNGAMVVNMSLGSSGDSDFLHNVIIEARRQGVLFFASAGNEPTTSATFPAAYSEVIAVTAGDRKGELASYANRGDFVDIVGPSGTIVRHNGNQYLVTGTSVASAGITGIAVGTADQNHKAATDVEAWLRKTFPFHKQN